MFNPTKAHKKEISEGQYKLRMGGRVPQGAVNLAYSYVAPLTPTENITISDSSSFILENVAAGREAHYALWPNEAYLLQNETGISDIYSQVFMLTDVFEQDIPLYYVHRCRYFHYDSLGPDEYGRYQGTTIAVIDKNGDKVKDGKVYQVRLTPSEHERLYYVDVFANFETKPGEEYEVLYNAIEVLDTGKRSIMTNHSERFNAKTSFTRMGSMYEILNSDSLSYYQMDSADFGYSQVSVPKRPIKDTRTPVVFRYQIQVTVHKDTGDELLYAPWIDAVVYHPNSLTADEPEYFNGFTHVSEKSAEEQVMRYLEGDPRADWLNIYPCEYAVISSHPDAIVDVKADGKEPVIASTEIYTGTALPPLNFRTYRKIPILPFDAQVVFKKKTGEEFVGATLPTMILPPTEGEKDIAQLDWSSLTFPVGYDASEWDLLLVLTDHRIPVTLSFYNQRKAMRQYPLPCEEVEGAMEIVIRAETHFAYKSFAPTYSLCPSDNRQIELLPPIASGVHENWYIRIQNGRFQRDYVDNNNLPKGHGYFLPEYYTQGFADPYGLPYRLVENEKPQVIGERLLRLRYTPLFITTDDATNKPNNITVTVNGVPLPIHTWDSTSGVLEMIGAVRETDNIEVRYYYQETAYEYRGYYNATEGKYIYLDLNPGPGHYSTQFDTESGAYIDLPSYSLINKTVYLYLRPAGETSNVMTMVGESIYLQAGGIYELNAPALQFYKPRVYLRYAGIEIPHRDDVTESETSWEYVDEGYVSSTIKINHPNLEDEYMIDYSYIGHKYQFLNGDFQRNVLFHSFIEIDEPNTILLGRVQVRPNSTYENISVIDTRTRGGGLLESIGRNIMNEVCPEATSYWDIAYWDGEPYQENAVLVIKLPRHILKKFGGHLTHEEVEKSVEKYMALGVFYVIEYEEDSLTLLEVPRHLVAEPVELEKIKPIELPVPEFELVVEG